MSLFSTTDLRYLHLLAKTYPNINATLTEIINLQAIVNLPKGTEHFVSDIHGEYEAFNHVIRNASGVIKNYIEELFGNTLMEESKKSLATLIYYPERKLAFVRKTEVDMDGWSRVCLFRMIRICKRVSSKYTRSKVRKALPKEFAYILEELIHEDTDHLHKQDYYNAIINNIISLGWAEAFIIAIANLIHRLAIDHLHIIGDIYDRGNGACRIMDVLSSYHSIDLQWGNHDISWMGAAAGSEACICNVIRICARYNNLDTLEEGYGINLLPLATFAMDVYKNSDCSRFLPETKHLRNTDELELDLVAKMHKAIFILQMKLEAHIIKRRKTFHMEDRLLLERIDWQKGIVTIEDELCVLIDNDFPTCNQEDPYALTKQEQDMLERIVYSFRNSDKLQYHARFLFNKGEMYTIYNNNLLFHGCIPLCSDGSFRMVSLFEKPCCGKELLDKIDTAVRKGYFSPENSAEKEFGLDLMWYLWCGKDSPLYGKDKMTTFERYFTNCEAVYVEHKDHYYQLRNDEMVCQNILAHFGLFEGSRIINGHVPVAVKKGESPMKANGRLLVIDGGFTKAYQQVTGIAGYTLISNSQGLLLASHEPFVSTHESIESNVDIVTSTHYISRSNVRIKVAETDMGKVVAAKIHDLKQLLLAYQNGLIKEQT